VLVVDDDPLYSLTLIQQLAAFGYSADSAADCRQAEGRLSADEYDLLLLDLRLPDSDGLTLLKKWRGEGLSSAVIMVSGEGTIPQAVVALKEGAFDFLVKPVDITILEAAVKRALKTRQLEGENRRLKELTSGGDSIFLGVSPAADQLRGLASRISSSDHPVLLDGETGTGKQVLARFIHHKSPRSGEPFVTVNCAAIVESLFESELFGHEKGAFTGAFARKSGKFELVGKGVLFLDEIGELPALAQAKLLTVVEDRTFERVGGASTIRFEGRIIAATNRRLDQEVEAGRFRRDQYYRLNTFRLTIPPLHERLEDLPLFIHNTLEHCSRLYKRKFELPDERILESLKAYSWPGNVRELIHHIERIALLSDTSVIPRQLWLSFSPRIEKPTLSSNDNLESATHDFRRNHISAVLKSCAGNQTQAAKLLGVTRPYLNRLLHEFGGRDESVNSSSDSQ
jgi:DNA-binding NtrC family response regulator